MLIFGSFTTRRHELLPHTCYQQVHAIWGMANGGIFRLGLGNSREKYGWLPRPTITSSRSWERSSA
jgi:cell division protein FtsW (lipid II flippase)